MNETFNSTIRQANHIIHFFNHVRTGCLYKLNDCCWEFEDENDPIYQYFNIHQIADHLICRASWILRHIPHDAKAGDPIQMKFLSLVSQIQSKLNYDQTLRTLRHLDVVSNGEYDLFVNWLCNLKMKLQNYEHNPSISSAEKYISQIEERIINKLSNEIRWVIKSRPKHVGIYTALVLVLGSRYNKINIPSNKHEVIPDLLDFAITESYLFEKELQRMRLENSKDADLSAHTYKLAKRIVNNEKQNQIVI